MSVKSTCARRIKVSRKKVDSDSVEELINQLEILCQTDILFHGEKSYDIFCIRNLYAFHMNEYLKKIQMHLEYPADKSLKRHFKILSSAIEDDRKRIFRPYGEP